MFDLEWLDDQLLATLCPNELRNLRVARFRKDDTEAYRTSGRKPETARQAPDIADLQLGCIAVGYLHRTEAGSKIRSVVGSLSVIGAAAIDSARAERGRELAHLLVAPRAFTSIRMAIDRISSSEPILTTAHVNQQRPISDQLPRGGAVDSQR
jgi:hypothetical protein